jgi:hypothetical protein
MVIIILLTGMIAFHSPLMPLECIIANPLYRVAYR